MCTHTVLALLLADLKCFERRPPPALGVQTCRLLAHSLRRVRGSQLTCRMWQAQELTSKRKEGVYSQLPAQRPESAALVAGCRRLTDYSRRAHHVRCGERRGQRERAARNAGRRALPRRATTSDAYAADGRLRSRRYSAYLYLRAHLPSLKAIHTYKYKFKYEILLTRCVFISSSQTELCLEPAHNLIKTSPCF